MTNVPLRVGCIPHFPLATLQRLLATLRHIAPDLTIEVSELLTVDQVRRLRDGLLDVGLFVRAEEFSDLEVQPVFPGLALAAFVSPNDPLAAKRVLTPDDLRAETLVTFPRSTNPPLFDMMLDRIEAQGYTFARLREATGPAPRDLFFEARAGAGVLISLGSLADSSELDGLLVARPLDPPVTTAETVLVHHADGTERMNALGRTLERTVSELRSTEGTNGRYVTGGDGAREEDSPTT
jgi:DNA-binding transcriptional LysR family regulator